MKYNFKDKYFTEVGDDIGSLYPTTFYSPIFINGTGTREEPFNSKIIQMPVKDDSAHIFSGGYHKSNISCSFSNVWPSMYFNGAGIGNTQMFLNLQFTSGYSNPYLLVKDFTFSGGKIQRIGGGPLLTIRFDNCEMLNIPSLSLCSFIFNNCIFRINPTFSTTIVSGVRNTYIQVDDLTLISNLNLYDNCNIGIAATDINALRNNYYAFSNCKFRIGKENDYTPLKGDTEISLRDDFKIRCEAQGIAVPDISDYGETLPMGRWVFANKSTIDGNIIKDSIIHNFEKRRFVKFGYSDARSEKLSISASKNIPSSFSTSNPNDKVVIKDNSISLPTNMDITKNNTCYAESNIIYLGGKKQINMLDIVSNMPWEYGVLVDAAPNLLTTATGTIEKDKHYIVRSSDKNMASIRYNGTVYTSSLLTRENIIKGVSGVASWTTVSGNPSVYEVVDELGYKSVQMRIVNNLPLQQITSGNLQSGYWYFVEPDNPDDLTGTIAYKSVVYPAYSSFLADSTLAFSKTGNCHLRRCWREDFNLDTETADKTFWQNEQKPQWISVLSKDMRCLMKNNSGAETEMQVENGNYIASGHELFYSSLLGNAGFKPPAYPIKGTYMQLRLVVSTLNPM